MKMCSYIFLFCLSLALNTSVSFAQIEVAHTPPQPQELPFPGNPLTLSITLLNSRDTQLTVKGYIVRDGKLMVVDLADFTSDDHDRIVYSTTINAPLGELNYNFVLFDAKGVAGTSDRYSVRRECLPRTNTIDTKLPEDLKGKARLDIQQKHATNLQDELKNYESVIKILDELKALTEK